MLLYRRRVPVLLGFSWHFRGLFCVCDPHPVGKARSELLAPMDGREEVMERRANIETFDRIVKSIKSFGDVSILPEESGAVKILAWPYTLHVKQHDVLYHWTIQAKDDASDKDEGYASDPMDAIIEAMSDGDDMAGVLWNKISSDPVRLASFLRSLAKTSPTVRNKALRRIAGFMRKSDAAPNPLLDLHEKEIEKLIRDMQARKWRAVKVRDDSSLPAIEFEIGDTFDGKIMLSKVMYEYEFSVDGKPEVTEKGVTDSVIRDLRDWAKRKDVELAADAVESSPTNPPKTVSDRPTGAEGLRKKK